jgi:hypothetical protein
MASSNGSVVIIGLATAGVVAYFLSKSGGGGGGGDTTRWKVFYMNNSYGTWIVLNTAQYTNAQYDVGFVRAEVTTLALGATGTWSVPIESKFKIFFTNHTWVVTGETDYLAIMNTPDIVDHVEEDPVEAIGANGTW